MDRRNNPQRFVRQTNAPPQEHQSTNRDLAQVQDKLDEARGELVTWQSMYGQLEKKLLDSEAENENLRGTLHRANLKIGHLEKGLAEERHKSKSTPPQQTSLLQKHLQDTQTMWEKEKKDVQAKWEEQTEILMTAIQMYETEIQQLENNLQLLQETFFKKLQQLESSQQLLQVTFSQQVRQLEEQLHNKESNILTLQAENLTWSMKYDEISSEHSKEVQQLEEQILNEESENQNGFSSSSSPEPLSLSSSSDLDVWMDSSSHSEVEEMRRSQDVELSVAYRLQPQSHRSSTSRTSESDGQTLRSENQTTTSGFPEPLSLSSLNSSSNLDVWDDSSSDFEMDEDESHRLLSSFSSSDPYCPFNFQALLRTQGPVDGAGPRTRARKPCQTPHCEGKEEAEERIDSGFSESLAAPGSSTTQSSRSTKKVRFCDDVEVFSIEEDRWGPWEELDRYEEVEQIHHKELDGHGFSKKEKDREDKEPKKKKNEKKRKSEEDEPLTWYDFLRDNRKHLYMDPRKNIQTPESEDEDEDWSDTLREHLKAQELEDQIHSTEADIQTLQSDNQNTFETSEHLEEVHQLEEKIQSKEADTPTSETRNVSDRHHQTSSDQTLHEKELLKDVVQRADGDKCLEEGVSQERTEKEREGEDSLKKKDKERERRKKRKERKREKRKEKKEKDREKRKKTNMKQTEEFWTDRSKPPQSPDRPPAPASEDTEDVELHVSLQPHPLSLVYAVRSLMS